MLRHLLFGTFLALASASCSENPSSPAGSEAISRIESIESIEVHFVHSGWGRIEEEFTVVPGSSAKSFVLRAKYFDAQDRLQSTEQNLQVSAVQNLLAAAEAPAWPRLAGVSAVAATVKPSKIVAKPSIRSPPSPCTHGELSQLARRYLKRKGMAALVDEHYGQGLSWTDDYPHVRLHIQLRDGPPLRLYSNSQKAMMLPWYPGVAAASPLESDQNWSLPLSRALQGILPKQSRLYERLGGDRLPERLSSKVDREADKECDSFGAVKKGVREH